MLLEVSISTSNETVYIKRVFPTNGIVKANQICHYDYGIKREDKMEKMGRVNQPWGEGDLDLITMVMIQLKNKGVKLTSGTPNLNTQEITQNNFSNDKLEELFFTRK